MRIVAAGCSHTWGEGLPDVYPKDGVRTEPSELAWPSLLGKKLNCDVKNIANRGAGNLEIMWRLLQFDLKPDDIVIVQWSHFVRYEFFRFDNFDRGSRIRANENLFMFDSDARNKNWALDNAIRNWFTIQHCSLWLESNKHKFLNLIFLNDAKLFPIPEKIHIPNVIDFYQSLPTFFVDKALDGSHPGSKTHELVCDTIYDKVLNYE